MDFIRLGRINEIKKALKNKAFFIFWTVLDYSLVEAAGVEPASENIPHRHLHT